MADETVPLVEHIYHWENRQSASVRDALDRLIALVPSKNAYLSLCLMTRVKQGMALELANFRPFPHNRHILFYLSRALYAYSLY